PGAFRIGIDTGGTFTDVVAVDEATGEVFTTKTPSTPADPSLGFMEGVRKLLAQLGAGPSQVAAISHGTTVATNALLQEQFRRLDCVGVCFLHAYANGAHERRMRDVLARVYPDAAVSISSEVLPEYREYERAMTTLVDAFVKPRVGRYVGRIQQRVESEIGMQ